ncbi:MULTISPECIES: polynucleotide kinase-phosphatase [Thermomonospora]|uniref:Bis(5'-nucleosyl)-tetraphosphatase(Asymmetrical) n=1 Tax=Thermomonospora curvata (strain ATCC 19995 / DSM 43183 / JCM 3096 / KCTC 9072 / NBRC 15933 / NCIMB 10081 / Henssen B9) TaxID=471852 RepID=D1AC31_THECD|nr:MULTISPECIES: polynucleotide kinase-phosphatase [Thermomonospora]ACY97297.1 Bis(5'-nucleosyl)-tetraphosphatase(asymmetrical) [Thermomonospora curvata DSM 43183]PKK14665.1 MAG: polynucleotide kinase-phosphatase [Thermomonospora sp. CIF 1]
MTRRITIPEMALVVLVGVSGSGKSHFARRHFKPTQIVSSDHCRAVVSDDENDQSATADAFDLLHYIVHKRLRRGLLTVVDATNVQPHARRRLVQIAKEHDVLPVAIVLDVPERVARERNAARTDRDLPDRVVARQMRELKEGMGGLRREFRHCHVLKGVAEIDAVTIAYEKAWSDKRELTGPFDIVGDVHGCRAELEDLLTELGYEIQRDASGRACGARHPAGRTAVFVGDLVDRGPDTPGVLRLVMGMVAAGTALCVAGNHEDKLVRALKGRRVKVAHGLAESLRQLQAEPEDFRDRALAFMDGLISHYVLDGGRLVVAHAGLKEAYHGRASGRVRAFALYGETTGETDEYGLPVRYPWANDYRGKAMVVYGHTPVPEPEWINNTICLDTGCVFGGRLTALRYPERELVSTPARRVWYEPARPLEGGDAAPRAGARRESDVLKIEDVCDLSGVQTRLLGRVTVREENALAALEVMSRFAIDPRWLVYLPPTMAPVATSALPDHLEHPAEAFAEYRKAGLERVVCEEKHMGSRAVVVLCRDAETAAARFGVADGTSGAVYTRTGRAFFRRTARTEELLARLREAVGAAGLWRELDTSWLVLDCELMPWSVKATELIRTQYAAAGAAARAALPAALSVLDRAAARGLEVAGLRERTRRRAEAAELFRDAYARYCRPVDGLNGVTLAPFQVLAGEGAVHATARDHLWHLAIAERLAAADPTGLLTATAHRTVELDSPESVAAATAWWRELTESGGEGMVVKPLGAPDGDRKVQPGLKCRGREYLRIIYGPDYTAEENLERLRDRRLGRKRSLAMREYALGAEALRRLVDGEPLWRVHQAVFAVLALESEPVDPRL